MKHVKSILFVLLFTGLLVSTFVPLTTPMTSNELAHRATPTKALSYDPHSDIFIVSDENFTDTAVGEGWAGDGSSGDPFIIEGYEIHSFVVTLIFISNTRYHFEIRDCNLTSAWAAIQLTNVTNGLIENCLIVDAEFGLFFTNVTGIEVVGCDISVHASSGISGVYMDHAIDSYVSSCVIKGSLSNSGSGIYVNICEGITLFNNTVFDFDYHGIFVQEVYDMDILNNTVYWNEGAGLGGPSCGILIVESLLAHIEGNNITQNADNGITISDTDNVTIIDNYIYENWIHGISIESSDYCEIRDNYIEGNGEGATGGPACGISTYFADYLQITGNEFWSNELNSITLAYSNFAYVSNNYLNHSYNHGMWIYMSHNATISANEIYNSYGNVIEPACGIYVEWSNDTQILDNILDHNSQNGITIDDSHVGELHANTISDSEFQGIYMIDASDWYISHNIIYDNGGPGIVMDIDTTDNYLWYNDIGWSGEFLVGDAGSGNFWNYTGVGNWYSDYDGSSTYPITGAAGEIDYYPSTSLYCGVTEHSEYEVGTTGNTMTWNSSALNPGTYELLIDSEPQGPVVWDGGAIAADVDGLPVGVYNVTLVTFHVSGHWLSNQSTLTVVDTVAPVWAIAPVDQHLEYGTPLSYQINATDPSGIDEYWLTGDAGFAIDSTGLTTNTTPLEVGTYGLIVHANDTFSHEQNETISIIVADTIDPVWVFVPANQEILENETFSYQLSASDLAGVTWSLTDSTNFTISGAGLLTNTTTLAPGVYYVEITVTDGHSNSISTTITITVNEVGSPPPYDPTMVSLAIGGLGAGVVILLVVFVLKKKQG